MGPFVPDIISDELNLIVALVLGLAFGFVLEQAGFSSSRRLAGVFYGYDFTVLRVFFTAAVTAMIGVLVLGDLGFLDLQAIYVNPTWLAPAIVGGVIMGLGFILGGYCPGTSVCAAAIGKVDAMLFVGGGVLGVFAFGEAYPLYAEFFDSTALGPITVFDSLGISQGLFAFLLIVVAVGAFAVTTIIERRVNPAQAPSLLFPKWRHILAGAGVVVIGVGLMVLPSRKESLFRKVSDPAYIAAHAGKRMTADELAFRIIDREPNIRLVDIRDEASFAAFALPGSVNLKLDDFLTKEAIPVLSQRHVKKIIIGETEQQEWIAGSLLCELGYENCAILEGGLQSFRRIILEPGEFVKTGGRWDDDVNRFRAQAKVTIPRMVEEQKLAATKKPKPAKKVQGGC